MKRAVITGTGRSLPDRILTNADLEKMVDTSDEWITTRTGIRERRIAAADEALSKFATAAGRNALEAAGVDPADVGLIVLATVTPDMPIPATACTIQHELGCRNAVAFDVAAGCSGFIYAQAIAQQFLENGQSDTALVIGGELLSKFVDWNDRATCVIFADGAGAVVMKAEDSDRGTLASAMHSDGSMADFICRPGGGSAQPPSQKMIDEGSHFIQMRGNETFKMAVRSIAGVCSEVLEEAGLTPKDVDWFIPHQANLRIISAVGQRLGIDEDRCYLNIDRIGNTSAASIPIALDEAVREGRITKGQIVLMAAFGAGLTWAASVVRW
ncbi:MAG: ketoacyl-ACP synthase III [Acidobacteriota bacterium]|nr:ketoacyl-ACP synthase III [Acidobacteriota bacterium]